MPAEPPPADATKRIWREWASAVRQELDLVTVARTLVDHLAEWLVEQSVATVLTYVAMPEELDLGELAGRLPSLRLAITRTPSRGALTLHPLTSTLERHPFGFLQPAADAPLVPPAEIGVALVPGMVFDRRGVRMGRGKGYFDELLDRLPKGTPRVGVAPAALVVTHLPEEKHDVRMTHLASEQGVVAAGDELGRDGPRTQAGSRPLS